MLVVDGEETGYGAAAPAGRTWREVFCSEVQDQISEAHWARVHFLGRLEREAFTRLLQVSRVHVYLSYPFVLSWSLLEAMSVGAAIVASDTAPVREVITPGETGQLVDFFDRAGLVRSIGALLDDAGERQRLGAAARAFAQSRYDLGRVCLPQQLAWVQSLSAGL
jgi:glycosyltransferase involved in cell wall biosynthesis